MEARFYSPSGLGIRCDLCPHHCIIREGQCGRCLVRCVKYGRLIAKNYGIVSSMSMDPIEKKPIHFYKPGTQVLSFGSYGCNFKCDFCQNHSISQFGVPLDIRILEGAIITPEEVARAALSAVRAKRPCIGVAYTYNEPTVWFEFVEDASRCVKEAGMDNILVTNGFIEEAPLKKLLPYIDAMNIDVKAFQESFYEDICKGHLEPVKRTVSVAHEAGIHIELTNLIIPGLNDSDVELEELCRWVSSLSPEIPLHLTRYFPRFERMTEETPVTTLQRLKGIAERYLSHVVVGNI